MNAALVQERLGHAACLGIEVSLDDDGFLTSFDVEQGAYVFCKKVRIGLFVFRRSSPSSS